MSTLRDFLRLQVAERIVKIEVLDEDENIIDEITDDIKDGNLQDSDNMGARRSASVVLDNISGDYVPDIDGIIWLNRKFRIKTGLLVSGTEYYEDRGIFVISEPQLNSALIDNTASIQLLDKFSLLDGTLGGKLEDTYVIPVGTTINTVVKDILTAAGEINPPIIEPNAVTTPYTIVKEADGTYGEILIELANMLSYTVYFDADGYLRFEPTTNITTTGSTWDFTTSEITYVSSNHKYEFSKVYNNIVVIGDNVNGTLCKATASDSSSDLGTAAIGKKTLVINDPLIYTVPLAQQRADAELLKAISLVETVDMTTIPVDIIKGGDIITVTDSSNGLSDVRFLVKSLSFPLKVQGDMTISGWQGREIV